MNNWYNHDNVTDILIWTDLRWLANVMLTGVYFSFNTLKWKTCEVANKTKLDAGRQQDNKEDTNIEDLTWVLMFYWIY